MIFFFILAAILSYLIGERMLHMRRLRRIPIRIHVNGTRGKSSVTRLVAAALQKNGIPTLAKTTGTRAVWILPDGREERIRRRGPARIQEQVRLIRKAGGLKARAVVVECMALDPFLQEASELQMIQSTVGVITNVRPDHFEVMGNSREEIAECLSQTIPRKGILVAGEEKYRRYFEEEAARRGTKVVSVRPDEKNTPWDRLRDNFLLAREVCSLLGCPPSSVPESLPASLAGRGEPEVLWLEREGKKIFFVDGFSANDVDSTQIIQQTILEGSHLPRPFVALLNNRADRPLRMVSFSSFLARGKMYDSILLAGDLKILAGKTIRRLNPGCSILFLSQHSPESILEEIGQKVIAREFTLVGLGNEKTIGRDLSDFFLSKGEIFAKSKIFPPLKGGKV